MSERAESGAAAFWGDTDDGVALQRYQTLVNTVDDGIYQLDAAGRFVAVNDIIVELCGYSREELLGEPVTLLLGDDDVERIGHDIYRHLTADERLDETYEFGARTADGQTIPCELRISLLVEDGTFQGSVGVVRDISDRKESKQALRESEQRFRSIVEAVEEYAIFMLDADGHVVSWNQGAEQIKGYRDEEILGQHFSTFYTDEDVEADVPEKNLAKARSTGATEDEGWRVRADGSRFWANVTITAIRDDDGTLQGYAKVTKDMTERRERERQIQRERDVIDRILDTSPVGIQVFDAAGDLARMNSRARGFLGVPEDQIDEYDPAAYSVYDEDGQPLSVDEYPAIRTLETGEPMYDCVLQVERPDGERRWLSVNAAPIRDDDGEVDRVIVAGDDITDLKQREREFKRRTSELSAELGEVFGRVSDAFFAVDEEFRFTHLNERAQELINPDGRELVGKSIGEAFPELTAGEFKARYERALKNQETVSFEEYYPAPLDAWFEVRAYPSESGLSVYFRDITDRKERERELGESERRYRTLAESFPNGIVTLFDHDLKYTLAAGQGFDRIPVDPDDLEGKSFREAWDADTAETLEPAFLAALDGDERSIELEYNGREWIFQTVPISDDQDGVFAGMTMARDITERKERERTLAKYETIVETINDGIYVKGEDGQFTMVNEAYAELTGYDREELVGEHASLVVDEATIEQSRELQSATVDEADGNPTMEATILTADDDHVPAEGTFTTLETDDGDREEVGVVRDISERKKRQRKLERHASQQRVVAELGQFALESDDLDELMHEAARQVATVLGNDYCKVLDLDRDAEELLLRQGVGWREGIVGTATVSSVEARSQAAVTLANEEPIVVRNLATDDRIEGPELLTSHDVTSGISTIIGSIDEPWGILGTHDTTRQEFTRDDVNFVKSVANVLAEAIERERYQNELEQLIENLEQSNERLEESNRRLEQFAYAASHDLQEPLRMVSSYLQLIENRYADALDEDGQEFLEFAVDGADRMRDMIEALLEYSRVETQGDSFEPVDLQTVLDDTLENLRVRIEETNAEITADSLPKVRGDASQLRQVFQNLLSNAIEYSGDAPPHVHVSADREAAEWRIAVRDEGIGIDPEQTDRIFRVFQRLHTHEEHAGTGIGLALCRRIVERHGGDIRVESTPGEGSTFYFTLPAEENHHD